MSPGQKAVADESRGGRQYAFRRPIPRLIQRRSGIFNHGGTVAPGLDYAGRCPAWAVGARDQTRTRRSVVGRIVRLAVRRSAGDPLKRRRPMLIPTFTRTSLLVAGCSALVLAACSPSAEPPANTEAEASAQTQEPMAMAQTPFSAAEAKMHEAMMSAMGADAGETWARKMIPHHQGALDMSEIVLRDTQDADIRRMAQKTIEMQPGDIAELRRWLETNVGAAAGAAAPGGSAENPYATAEAEMKDAMMAATGADTDQTWARKMIAHHQGALDMAQVVLRESQDADIRRMAQITIEMQTADIAELRAWLDSHPAGAA
ncbi:MAG TPA: hypothetical protein DCG66_03085 [Brevundimonas sp.]|nr:hypothetical protein [Brevundimonas sp.]